jgi:hypothetical protein
MQQSLVTEAKVMLVAVEYGGEWRVGLRPSADADLVMVVQVDGEDPLLFARRFLRKVIALVAEGADVVSAVLAVAPNFDLRQLEARCAIARTILRAFRHGSKSELYLVEPSNAKPDCLAHLLAIAEGLTDNAATDCRIRVGYDTIDKSSATRQGTIC